MNHQTPKRITSLLLALVLLASACSSGEEVSTTTDKPKEAAPVSAIEEASSLLTVADPLVAEQWAISATNLDSAWTVASGEGAVIAIVDSGVDLDHPDLVDRLVPGWDFIDSDDQPDDENGHGTHVAGAAAATTNAIGIAGAAPEASIMPVRVLDASGAGSDDVIAEGIIWAADNGADVINLSLGESGVISRLTRGSSLNRAIRYATELDVVVVAASGNEGSAGQQYRIGVDVLVVNASNDDGSIAEFSNVGDVRSISAPGVGIVSTSPIEPTTIWPEGTDGYSPLDGTSMATPLVSGVAALLISSGVPADQVIDQLTNTAVNPTNDPLLGAGVVDAAAALGIDPSDELSALAPGIEAPEEVAAPAEAEPAVEPEATEEPEPAVEPEEPTAVPEEPTAVPEEPTATPVPVEPTPAPTPVPPPAATPVPAPEAPADPPVSQGTGSLTLVITYPVSYSATVDADVSCSVTGVRYNASVGTTDLGHGYSASANVTVVGYSGPGTYPAGGLVQVSTPSGDFPVPLVGVATIQDDLGGSVDAVTEGFDGYIAWECNS